jgi:hypothetical protein
LARNLSLDQVDRDALLLGADHPDDSCGHWCFPGRCCLIDETRNEAGKQATPSNWAMRSVNCCAAWVSSRNRQIPG